MPRILKTKDYGMFECYDWNREIKPQHVASLMKSMNHIGNVTDLLPIVVHPKDKKFKSKDYPNGKHKIIDGQFRFASIKLHNDWVYYVVDEDKRIKPGDVSFLQTSKPWTSDDYLNYYCSLGFKEYKVYSGFKKRSGWGHNCVQILLMGNTKGVQVSFREGNFVCLRSIQEANVVIDMINEFKPHFRYYKQRSFILAMLYIIENVPEYDNNRMMQKMDYLSERLVRCPNRESYVMLLEKLYNFKATGVYVRFI